MSSFSLDPITIHITSVTADEAGALVTALKSDADEANVTAGKVIVRFAKGPRPVGGPGHLIDALRFLAGNVDVTVRDAVLSAFGNTDVPS